MTKIDPLICVVGPTASGKTSLAVGLAKAFDAEVLSFDSMQLYKGMDVATAKPTPEEMQGVPHHMIDCVDPQEPYSVARYKEDAERIIGEIRGRGKNVVMVGGTGLYLDTLLKNIEFLDAGDDGHVRRELQEECRQKGAQAMYEELQRTDPEYAAKIQPNNVKRVLRALEVYRLTGYTMSYQIEQSRKTPPKYRAILIGLNARDRNVLYDRINRRVDLMVEHGLLSETEEYLQHGAGTTAAQAIGIKEMIPYVQGQASLEECKEKLKLDTRHYAKRQLTWFRRNPEVHWLYLDDYPSGDSLLEAARQLVLKELVEQ